ncbi:helix-turn-helix transcriptional regulator [Providencia rettgeri]|uniref:helix-turn-helix domain-containing protein n=1 Tax=Providencia rettgeri TaxID=587 RepID=UPI0032DBDB51
MHTSILSRLAGAKLKAERVSKGYKRHEIAQKLSKSDQQLFRYERGINKMDLDTLINYCHVLSIDIHDFFDSLLADTGHNKSSADRHETSVFAHPLNAA